MARGDADGGGNFEGAAAVLEVGERSDSGESLESGEVFESGESSEPGESSESAGSFESGAVSGWGESSSEPAAGFESGADGERDGLLDHVVDLPGLTGGSEDEGELDAESVEEEENDRRATALRLKTRRSYEKKRMAETMRHLNDLIALRPYNPYYHFALGLCYRQEKQYEDARKKYQEVLDLGGPKALVAILKAEVFAEQGRRDRVFEMLREAALGGRNIINDVQHLPLLEVFEQETEFVQLALQLEKVEIQQGRRHDPFTNPFPTVGLPPEREPGDGGELTVEDLLPPREQQQMVKEARRIHERIQFFIKLQDQEKAMQAYTKLKSLVAQKSRLDIPRYVKDFQAITDRFEQIEVEISGIRLRYYYDQAKGKIASMKERFEGGEYEEVNGLYGQVRRLADEMIGANTKFTPVAGRIVDLAGQWVARAEVRLEFDSRKPEIQGIILSDPSNMAILNHRIVKQGEGFSDFRVVKVESNRVTFRYKGEEIPLMFRRY